MAAGDPPFWEMSAGGEAKVIIGHARKEELLASFLQEGTGTAVQTSRSKQVGHYVKASPQCPAQHLFRTGESMRKMTSELTTAVAAACNPDTSAHSSGSVLMIVRAPLTLISLHNSHYAVGCR